MQQVVKPFRLDINGLRAIAVISVVMYHFGIYDFNAGFIGVDIFFVISGFLMTKIIISGMELNNFSLVKFYLDRAKRIIPALLFLCLVVIFIAWLILPRQEYIAMGKQSLSAILFISNFLFWSESGYFDSTALDKWLLHTWSLSVEWQFYMLLPIILIIVYKYLGKRWIVCSVCIMFVISLFVSVVWSKYFPTASFYLLPSRAWEMLSGGLVWLMMRRVNYSKFRSLALEVSGLALIILSIIIFSTSSSWPSGNAIIPVFGASLILIAARNDSIFTSNKFFQWVGLRSYSIYLWHWPIVVLISFLGFRSDTTWIVCGLLATVIAGDLSYRLIESKTRVYLGKISVINGYGVIFVSMVSISLISILVRYGNPGVRIPDRVEMVSSYSQDINRRNAECFTPAGENGSPSCIYGDKVSAILIGDSHANSVVTSIQDSLSEIKGGVMFWGYNGCPTIIGAKRDGYSCESFNSWIFEKLKSIDKSVPIIIINRTSVYINGLMPNEDKYTADGVPLVYFSNKNELKSETLEKFKSNFLSTTCEIAKNHKVFLVRPIPEMGVDVPKHVSRSILFRRPDVDVSISLDSYHKRHEFVWEAQDEASKKCGVKILDPLPYLCKNGRCDGSVKGIPRYYDDDHLNEHGNKLLKPMFDKILEN